MAKGTCVIENCAKPAKNHRGWCSTHYSRWLRHGDPLARKSKAPCDVEGCDAPSNARGWCKRHYARWYQHGDPTTTLRVPPGAWNGVPCAVGDCGGEVKARGWCRPHYNRWRSHGDPEGGKPSPRPRGSILCSIDGCTEGARSRGWCARHYQKWYFTGDAEAPDKRTRRNATLAERIEAFVVKTDPLLVLDGQHQS